MPISFLKLENNDTKRSFFEARIDEHGYARASNEVLKQWRCTIWAKE
jgi:hypothetical protein